MTIVGKTVTGMPLVDCVKCGKVHPIKRKRCVKCGRASLFLRWTIDGVICMICVRSDAVVATLR